jgi:hypothetical protein
MRLREKSLHQRGLGVFNTYTQCIPNPLKKGFETT